MNLDELRSAVAPGGSGRACHLDPGVFLVTETIVVGRSDVTVSGTGDPYARRSVLRRGRLEDGSLFKGPLIMAQDKCGISLCQLHIDGSRFERVGSRMIDHRHPVNPDRSAPDFTCGHLLPAPECYAAAHFGSDIEAEILLFGCEDVALRDLTVRDAITIGVAIGPGSRRVALDRVRLERCGQFGVWIGAALPTRPALPLSDEVAARLPSVIRINDTRFERCGAAAVFAEGRGIDISACEFIENHCDFPFNEEGGQLVIDYKTEDAHVTSCRFRGEPPLHRTVLQWSADAGAWRPAARTLGAVAIEACGRSLRLMDVVASGHAREAIHLNGARSVVITGARTRLEKNHLQGDAPGKCNETGAKQNISITTTSEMAHLGALASDISIDSIRCENGIVVWSNGSVPHLTLDGLRLRGNDLSGPYAKGDGLNVGLNPDGKTLKGSGWQID